MENIILASASPQRQEYLRLLGLPFTSMPPQIKEIFNEQAEPGAIAEELAVRKVKKVLETLKNENVAANSPFPSNLTWILGADTLICLDGKVYGKPFNRKDAGGMLHTFQGRTHQVITAIALYNGKSGCLDCRSVVSNVTFAPLSKDEIDWYLDSGEWQEAAGSYKIQGLASCFIKEISGSYSSIVGLPVRELYEMLKDNGYPLICH